LFYQVALNFQQKYKASRLSLKNLHLFYFHPMKNLPAAFLKNLEAQLGDDLPAFISAMDMPPPVSIRLNPQKKAHSLTAFQTEPNPIAWHTEGYYLAGDRPVFTLDPAYHGGAYYVQEASSMFIAEALRQVCNLAEDKLVLDLCAAPGGKSTLLASLLTDNSFLIANEVIKSRVEILKENIIRWGNPSVCVSHHEVEDFADLAGLFDIVLIDAPCSGEGLFRKDPDAIREWSEEAVVTCSARQKRLLTVAASFVKPEGILLYSTCTYNESENKENVEWLLQHGGFQMLSLDIKPDWGILARSFGYQFYPHRLRGEGFFMAALKADKSVLPEYRKSIGEEKMAFEKLPVAKQRIAAIWLQEPEKLAFFIKPNGMVYVILKKHTALYAQIDKVLKRKSIGVEIGIFKGQDFIPSHDLAMSTLVATKSPAFVTLSLSKTQALQFLKKEAPDLDFENLPQTWALATYEGLNLGWMKILKNRLNNYLPKDFRIRMDLPR
jgi:16S rRNA C967 or C1407 C5-methylase (RsmB/RsmF family)/NOL1/NOP2/fmu family ribosome biogenesis protein